MKALKGEMHALWLVALIAFVTAIVIYRVGFHRAVPAFDEEAIRSLKNQEPQEVQTQPKQEPPPAPKEESQPAPKEPALQTPQSADLKSEKVKERRYRSERPLYFRVVFGQEGNGSILGVLDETGGTGSGYNVAYIDENRNGDLADEAVKEFPRRTQSRRAGELEPRFEFTGPLKGEQVKYKLYIYSIAQKNRRIVPGNSYHFHWFLDTNQWSYFFINGRMTLFSSAAEALKGKPVRLTGQCQWEINTRTRSGKPTVSAGLKDENGCTLRIVRRAGKTVSPKLSLIQDGKIKAEEDMRFG
jgi:hypothetical protein